MRERLVGIAAAVVLVMGVVAAATEADPPEDPLTLVAGARAAAVEAGSARLAMRYELRSEEMTFGFSADGVVDFASGAGQLTLSAGGQDFDIRNDGATTYVAVPEASRSISSGRPWVSYPNDDPSSPDIDFGGGARLDLSSPISLLDQLAAIGEVEDLGTDEVNGTDAAHYRTQIDLAGERRPSLEDTAAPSGDQVEDVVDELAPEPTVLDVWIADDLPTRISMTSTFGFIGPAVSQLIELDLIEYGITVDVDLPPTDQVQPVDDNILGQLLQPAFAAMVPASSEATSSASGILAPDASDAVIARYCAAHAQLITLVDANTDTAAMESALAALDGAAEDARAEGAISAWASMTAVASAARAYITTLRLGDDTGDARELLDTVAALLGKTCG